MQVGIKRLGRDELAKRLKAEPDQIEDELGALGEEA